MLLTFKDFFQLYTENVDLYTEGMLALPRHVFQEILDHYIYIYNYTKKHNVKRISEGLSARLKTKKIFKIDLSNTRFAFLHEPSPHMRKNGLRFQSIKVTVDIKFADSAHYRKGTGWGSPDNYILLNLHDGPDTAVDVLEHELLHLIQYSIEDHRLSKNPKSGLPSQYDYNNLKSGLPPKNMIDQSVDTDGYKKEDDNKKKKRVQHTTRPIEYYPDLLSAIRSLQYEYQSLDVSARPSRSDYIKEFFKTVHSKDSKDIQEKSRYYRQAHRIFKTMRDHNFKLYQRYIKITWNEFVNFDTGNIDLSNFD